jgi:uncharacterized membrane protein
MSFIVLLSLAGIIGCVLGWVAFFRTTRLEQELHELRRQVQALRHALSTTVTTQQPQAAVVPAESVAAPMQAQAASAATTEPNTASTQAATQSPTSSTPPPPPVVTARKASTASKPQLPTPAWLAALREHWMVWLGGLCVGLAGIFMVKYSMDQGYLGPTARVISGGITGMLLHVGAEWLRRHKPFHPAFAALAAGGSLTLFAAVLSALHLYQLLPAGLSFALLALVALVTMALALLHGPVLAILGLLGAYAVPLLVGGNGDGAAIALVYALIIACAALWLMRYIYRRWLWLGMLAGLALWFLLGLGSEQTAALRGLYLAVLAYACLAIPAGDWLLQQVAPLAPTGFKRYFSASDERDALLPASLLLFVVLLLLAMVVRITVPSQALNWLALPALLLFAARHKPYLRLHVVLLLLGQLLMWLLAHTESYGDFRWYLLAVTDVNALHRFCLAAVLVYSGLAYYNLRRTQQPGWWMAVLTLAPLLWLSVDWLLTPATQHNMQWPLLALLIGSAYGALATRRLARQQREIVTVWLLAALHLGYSLAVAIQLEQASLTLALAVQLISLAWLVQQFAVPQLGWLLKIVAAVVAIRLSLNPWLFSYPTGVHWSLWTYGGATLCCVLAARLLQRDDDLRRWTQGAAVHLFALFCWAELRYWLYDGNVYAREYSYLEASLTQSLAAALALIYYWRSQLSSYIGKLYRAYSWLLLGLACANYLLVALSTLFKSSWAMQALGTPPPWNVLLLSLGLPVLWAVLCSQQYAPLVRKGALVAAAVMAFLFISVEIHHLWQYRFCVSCGFTDGELYTYSIVWLLLAALTVGAAVWRYGRQVYRAGMLLLLLVIAKLFLWDMADLSGLWRVASFMGMGLMLLLLGYLHKSWQQRLQASSNSSAH